MEQEKKEFWDSLQETASSLIVVTNEVGWGIIADNALSRSYAQELGAINCQTAKLCSEVYLMVAGRALRLPRGIH